MKIRFENDIKMCTTSDCPLEMYCLRKNAVLNQNPSAGEFKPEPDDLGVIKCDGYIYSVIA